MKTLLIAISCSAILTACKKDKDDISIKGFDVFDASGNQMGHDGPDDQDWTFDYTLSQRELDLFNFEVPGQTADNNMQAVTTSVHPYPNPAAYQQYYYFQTSETALIKIVVVNKNWDVLLKTAVKVYKGGFNIAVDLSDRTKFPNKTSYRVYYSFSATGKPNYKSGYGDIRICESPSSWQDCFH